MAYSYHRSNNYLVLLIHILVIVWNIEKTVSRKGLTSSLRARSRTSSNDIYNEDAIKNNKRRILTLQRQEQQERQEVEEGEEQSKNDSSHQAQDVESFIELPPLKMRLAFSVFEPAIPHDLKNELLRLTVEHLSEFYHSSINILDGYSMNVIEDKTQFGEIYDSENKGSSSSTFDRFYLSASITSDDLPKEEGEESRYLIEDSTDAAIFSLNAMFDGYAIFLGVPSETERYLIENLPTLAFMGAHHQKYLERIKSSSNTILSEIVQFSVITSIQHRTGQKTDLEGETLLQGDDDWAEEREIVYTKEMRTALAYVLVCFLMGIMTGILVVYNYKTRMMTHPDFGQDDDETEETSRMSFPKDSSDTSSITSSAKRSYSPRDGFRSLRKSSRQTSKCARRLFSIRNAGSGPSALPSAISMKKQKKNAKNDKNVQSPSMSFKKKKKYKQSPSPKNKFSSEHDNNDRDIDDYSYEHDLELSKIQQREQQKQHQYHHKNNNDDRKKPARRMSSKNRLAPLDVMSSIMEESDGELYSDYIDDVVKGEKGKLASRNFLFPKLQDRLSNKMSSRPSTAAATASLKEGDNNSDTESGLSFAGLDDVYSPRSCIIPEPEFISQFNSNHHAASASASASSTQCAYSYDSYDHIHKHASSTTQPVGAATSSQQQEHLAHSLAANARTQPFTTPYKLPPPPPPIQQQQQHFNNNDDDSKLKTPTKLNSTESNNINNGYTTSETDTADLLGYANDSVAVSASSNQDQKMSAL